MVLLVVIMEFDEISQRLFDSFCGCSQNGKCKNDVPSCNCGEEYEIYEWAWDGASGLNKSASLSENHRDVLFHKTFSSGTAAVRGSVPFKQNCHYYWEIKMLSTLYGTDVMVGVGTDNVDMNLWPYRFCSLLGLDKESWGYSYRGEVQHNGKKHEYGPKFGQGSIIGAHLDMCAGTLEYYHNRRPLGVAFTGLKSYRLYPMVCSTAAQSAMRITCALSVVPNLQLLAIQRLMEDSCLYESIDTVPGLRNMLSKRFWWLLVEDKEEEKPQPPPTGVMMVVIENDDDDADDEKTDVRTVRKRKRETATISGGGARLTDGPTSSAQLQINPSLMIFAPCESCGIVRAVGTKKSLRINKNRICLYCDGLT